MKQGLPHGNRDPIIPLFKVFMPESVMAPLHDVLMGGYIGEGPKVRAFEQALAPLVGREELLAVQSGTAALQLALQAAGVRPGSEVITTPLTCVATSCAIVKAGGRIRFADVDPETGNIDPADVERKLGPETSAILPVHFGGNPCRLEDLESLAASRGIPVIEDAAHALGATHRGTPIGSHSDFVCFSFQAVKLLTTVDGGAVTFADRETFERARLLRWYGLDREARRKKGIDDLSLDLVEAGWKFHMNDVAATIGLAQLPYLSGNLARQRANASAYDAAFSDLSAIRLVARSEGSSCWLYSLLVPDLPRFKSYLRNRGIIASRVHVRNDRYTAFRAFREPLEGLDRFTARHVCIPVGWWLGEREVDRVIDAVRTFDRTVQGSSWKGAAKDDSRPVLGREAAS